MNEACRMACVVGGGVSDVKPPDLEVGIVGEGVRGMLISAIFNDSRQGGKRSVLSA